MRNHVADLPMSHVSHLISRVHKESAPSTGWSCQSLGKSPKHGTLGHSVNYRNDSKDLKNPTSCDSSRDSWATGTPPPEALAQGGRP